MKIGNLNVYGVIYKITNKVNGMIYIGQTRNKNGFNGRYSYRGKGIERVYETYKREIGKNKRYNVHLFNSIKKYGFDNFEVNEIFDVAFSQKELNIKEELWIKYYKSDKKDFGYNHMKGGDNHEYSEDTYTKSQSIMRIGFDVEDYKDFIINSYNNGQSGTYIGDKLKVSYTTIYAYLDKWGVKRRDAISSHLHISINDYTDDIIQLYKDGKSISKIAKIYNVSSKIISRIIYENNIIPPKKLQTIKLEENKEYIIYLYNQGNAISEISSILNIGRTAIQTRLKKWGVETRNSSVSQIGFNIEEFTDDIIDMYVNKKMSMKSIGKYFGVGEKPILRILVKNKIHKVNKRK